MKLPVVVNACQNLKEDIALPEENYWPLCTFSAFDTICMDGSFCYKLIMDPSDGFSISKNQKDK